MRSALVTILRICGGSIYSVKIERTCQERVVLRQHERLLLHPAPTNLLLELVAFGI